MEEIRLKVKEIVNKHHADIIWSVYKTMLKQHKADYSECECEYCRTNLIYVNLKIQKHKIIRFSNHFDSCLPVGTFDQLFQIDRKLKKLKEYRKQLKTI